MGGYSTDLTLKTKVLPRNLRGVLPISSAVEMSLATASRAWKPLPPGNVKLNGQPYASWPATTSGETPATRVIWPATGSGLRRADECPGCARPSGLITLEI